MPYKIGPEFEFRNPEIPPGGTWNITKEIIAEASRQQEDLKKIIGNVIYESIRIEKRLDNILAIFFTQKFGEVNVIDDKFKLFHEFVLSGEFFSFHQKWRVFRQISKKKLLPKKYCSKQLRKDIKEVIDTRDIFAHGRIFFQDTQACLEYFRDGLKKIELTTPYFDERNKLFEKTISELDELEKKMFGISKVKPI